jgi:glycosyltransferase involved in cell wall biosynthesis
MTVSVVIPTRNYGRYLGEAIDSLRRQTYKDWECVVVDDGSTDGTAEIVAALAAADGRIAYVGQAAAGSAAARNAGLAATSGEFVQFLDADDLLGPGKLRQQIDTFARHPEADIVYGGVRYFIEGGAGDGQETQDDRLGASLRRSVTGSGESVLAALVDDNFMVVEAPIIRRSLIEKVGGFDPEIRRMEDWECWLRCALAGGFFLHDGADEDGDLAHVRIHRASISQDQIAMHQAAVQVRTSIDSRLPTRELHRLNHRRIHEQQAIIGMLQGLGTQLRSGMRHLIGAGLAERNVRWLAWGILMPVVRRPPGSWAMRRMRTFLAHRRGEEVRDWQTHQP